MTDAYPRPKRGMWFEDFAEGLVMHSPGRTIGESDIYRFGGLTGDLYELHTNEEYARGTIFGTRIAHGLLGLSVMHGLMCRTGHVEGTGVAMIGWDKVRHRAPVLIGDTVRTRWRVKDARPSRSRPGTGVVVEFVELLNQRDEVVLEGEYISMVRMRDPEAAPAALRTS
jgi:acyl dehydratase